MSMIRVRSFESGRISVLRRRVFDASRMLLCLGDAVHSAALIPLTQRLHLHKRRGASMYSLQLRARTTRITLRPIPSPGIDPPLEASAVEMLTRGT